MAHVRQQIRADVVTRLSGMVHTGTNVVSERAQAVAAGWRNYVSVWIDADRSEDLDKGDPYDVAYGHTLELSLVIVAITMDELEATAEELEMRMAQGFQGYQNISAPEVEFNDDADGGYRFVSCEYLYTFEYTTNAMRPSELLP